MLDKLLDVACSAEMLRTEAETKTDGADQGAFSGSVGTDDQTVT